jgi:hypothetical protein
VRTRSIRRALFSLRSLDHGQGVNGRDRQPGGPLFERQGGNKGTLKTIESRFADIEKGWEGHN